MGVWADMGVRADWSDLDGLHCRLALKQPHRVRFQRSHTLLTAGGPHDGRPAKAGSGGAAGRAGEADVKLQETIVLEGVTPPLRGMLVLDVFASAGGPGGASVLVGKSIWPLDALPAAPVTVPLLAGELTVAVRSYAHESAEDGERGAGTEDDEETADAIKCRVLAVAATRQMEARELTARAVAAAVAAVPPLEMEAAREAASAARLSESRGGASAVPSSVADGTTAEEADSDEMVEEELEEPSDGAELEVVEMEAAVPTARPPLPRGASSMRDRAAVRSAATAALAAAAEESEEEEPSDGAELEVVEMDAVGSVGSAAAAPTRVPLGSPTEPAPASPAKSATPAASPAKSATPTLTDEEKDSFQFRGQRARPRKKIEYLPRRGELYLKPPGSCNTRWSKHGSNVSVSVECCEDCTIYILDACDQVQIAECKNCRVVVAPTVGCAAAAPRHPMDPHVHTPSASHPRAVPRRCRVRLTPGAQSTTQCDVTSPPPPPPPPRAPFRAPSQIDFPHRVRRLRLLARRPPDPSARLPAARAARVGPNARRTHRRSELRHPRGAVGGVVRRPGEPVRAVQHGPHRPQLLGQDVRLLTRARRRQDPERDAAACGFGGTRDAPHQA